MILPCQSCWYEKIYMSLPHKHDDPLTFSDCKDCNSIIENSSHGDEVWSLDSKNEYGHMYTVHSNTIAIISYQKSLYIPCAKDFKQRAIMHFLNAKYLSKYKLCWACCQNQTFSRNLFSTYMLHLSIVLSVVLKQALDPNPIQKWWTNGQMNKPSCAKKIQLKHP